MSIDLSAIRQSDTALCEITHPATGEPTGWVIEIAGPGHPATLRQRNKLLTKARASQAKNDMTAEQFDHESADFLAARIVGWDGLVMDGHDVPFTHEAAKEILSDYGYSFVSEQLNKFVLSAASFLSKYAKA